MTHIRVTRSWVHCHITIYYVHVKNTLLIYKVILSIFRSRVLSLSGRFVHLYCAELTFERGDTRLIVKIIKPTSLNIVIIDPGNWSPCMKSWENITNKYHVTWSAQYHGGDDKHGILTMVSPVSWWRWQTWHTNHGQPSIMVPGDDKHGILTMVSPVSWWRWQTWHTNHGQPSIMVPGYDTHGILTMVSPVSWCREMTNMAY